MKSLLEMNGAIVSFNDNTAGNYDLYGQHVSFIDGSLLFGSSGTAIASGSYDQKSSTLAYNQDQNEVLVCYEAPDGTETGPE